MKRDIPQTKTSTDQTKPRNRITRSSYLLYYAREAGRTSLRCYSAESWMKTLQNVKIAFCLCLHTCINLKVQHTAASTSGISVKLDRYKMLKIMPSSAAVRAKHEHNVFADIQCFSLIYHVPAKNAGRTPRSRSRSRSRS